MAHWNQCPKPFRLDHTKILECTVPKSRTRDHSCNEMAQSPIDCWPVLGSISFSSLEDLL